MTLLFLIGITIPHIFIYRLFVIYKIVVSCHWKYFTAAGLWLSITVWTLFYHFSNNIP